MCTRRIKKVYETIINLSPTEMYADIDAVILEKLVKYFQGRCREESYIFKILGIQKRSQCRISKSLLDGSGSVNVQFLAEAVSYQSGDLLPSCEILRIERTHNITCQFEDHALVVVRRTRNLQGLRVGQKIPVQVLKAKHRRGRDKVTITGDLFYYPLNFTIWSFSEPGVKGEELEIFKNRIQELKLLEEEGVSGTAKYFQELFYPFKKGGSKRPWEELLPKKAAAELVSLHSLDLRNEKFLREHVFVRHPWIEKSTPMLLALSVGDGGTEEFLRELVKEKAELFNPEKFNFSLVDEKPVQALLQAVDDCARFLCLLRELSIQFPTENSLGEQKPVWEIYRFLKKEV